MQKAIDSLRKQGFKDDQIYTEYPIVLRDREFGPYQKVKSVDVAGIKPEKAIAIECGMCTSRILEVLGTYFDEVLHFPFVIGHRYCKRAPTKSRRIHLSR